MLAVLSGVNSGALAAPPATKPVNPINSKSIAAVDSAARALAREFAQAHSGSGKVVLRRTCDFFQERPSQDVTTEAILAALERSAQDDSPQTNYVRWQLISGINGDLSRQNAARATAIYRNLGLLQKQPGMEQMSRSDLELRRRSCREEGVAELNKYISDEQALVNAANAPMLAFRDELLSRLPPSYDTIAAGFEDAQNRLKAGADTKEIVTRAAEVTRQWASQASAQQLNSLADALRTLSKERGTQYFDSVSWSESSRKVTFYKKSPTLDKKTLETLADELTEQARNPTPGGLKFKDDGKKKDNKDRP